MTNEYLIQRMRDGRGPQAASLEEYFAAAGIEAWNQLRDVARRDPGDVDDVVVDWASVRISECPHAFFALLLDIAAKDEERRDRMIGLFRQFVARHPGPALHAAGYNLHEFHRLLDHEWLAVAREHFDHSPEGAFGIFESAAMYQPQYVSPETVDFFEAHRSSWPRDYFVAMLSLARHRPAEAPGFLARVMRAFSEHPADAVRGTSFAARDCSELLVPELIASVLQYFESATEEGWEFFDGASTVRREVFDDVLLDALTVRTSGGPGKIFTILGHLLDSPGADAERILERYVTLVRRFPAEGIDAARYGFQLDAVRLVSRGLVRAICEGFTAAPYPAYQILWHCARSRPELVGRPEIEAALGAIPHATNRAFGFFSELLKIRPEFTHECTLAMFECLANEPAYRAFVRVEEIDAINAVAEMSLVRTSLEKALREPISVGSLRARALMAIMFRQKLRAKRHVLMEALRFAASVVQWRDVPGAKPELKEETREKFSPIWDHLMFVIDVSSQERISAASAERFLEGAFQLHYLCRTGAEHDEFVHRLDIGYPPQHPLRAGTAFLGTDADLVHLYNQTVELGKRFGVTPRLLPLREFEERLESARQELEVVRRELARADGGKPDSLQAREKGLERRIGWWQNSEYVRAFADPESEARLEPDARAFLRREKKELAKRMRDALRAEAVEITVTAIDKMRGSLYRSRLREILGRDVGIERVDPRILPSFLWFQAVENMPGNSKYLRRLIEDRVEGRPHDWLRTEPPAVEWAKRVKTAQPQIRLDRWRTGFSKEFHYRPQDAAAEKQRRIKADLAQARALLEKAGVRGVESDSWKDLASKLAELREAHEMAQPGSAPQTAEETDTPPPTLVDHEILDEVAMNLERVRLAEAAPESEFEGKIVLSVESDPFEILFMGEYGFASCLSLRGSNSWSAVSNAIDIDKTIAWAREPGGNVVGRRLLALVPTGILMYRTYTNRHGLALDHAFEEFVSKYAAFCGTVVTHRGRPGPLLSDEWYDDGAI